jgi:hypothetical protein
MGYIHVWNIWDSSNILQGIKNIDCSHGISYYSRSLGHDILYGEFHAKCSRPASIPTTGDNPQSIPRLHMHVTRLPKYTYIYNVVVLATPEGIT